MAFSVAKRRSVYIYIYIYIYIYNSIRKKTGAQNIVKEIKQYKQKWLQHVQRVGTDRLPMQALRYTPKVDPTCTEDGHKQTTKAGTAL
jgi:hypothetical protein